MSGRAILFLASSLALLAVGGRGADASLDPYARVEIAATRTSIYVGTVSMTMPAFTRANGQYESTYTAKVFPFFFYNETGRLSVAISDEALQRLAHGETVEFSGSAINAQGETRRVEGKATPADAAGGKVKVRVFVSRRIELIFNTTYRFPAAQPVAPAPP